MKSSPERTNAENTKRLKHLATKLQTVDSFDTYESNCRPNRDVAGKRKNTILKKEFTFCKKINTRKRF